MITKKVEAKAPGRQGLHGRESPTRGKGKILGAHHTWEAQRKMKAKIKFVTKGSTYLQKQRRQDLHPKGTLGKTGK